jgi:hypothetical protein
MFLKNDKGSQYENKRKRKPKVNFQFQETAIVVKWLACSCDYPVFTAGFDGVHVAHLFIFCDVLYCAFVFCLSSSCVLCAHCCQCLLIVYSWLPPRFSLPIIYYSLWFYPNGDRTHDLPQRIRGEHANHFTTIAVSWNWKFTFGFLLRLFSWQQWAHKTQDEDKQNTKAQYNTSQKIKRWATWTPSKPAVNTG